jgi:predicted acylesterase/phospholipase RssA
VAVDPRQIWPPGGPQPLILALTGGGFRGYFTAQVLAHVEGLLGAPCRTIFDLFAGTSIGGIIALALANGVPANTIATTIREKGPDIFPSLRFIKGRRMLGAPYTTVGIRDAFTALLVDRFNAPLKESLNRVMVVTVSPATAEMVVARSWDLSGTGEMTALDAALATSAAPTYFPAHRAVIGNDASTELDLIDGGIAANAPDALAIHYAVTELGFPEDRISVFSVGTCGVADGGITGERPPASGFVGTLFSIGGSGIINLMMAIQETRGVSEATSRVGFERYLRVDETPSEQQAKHLQLDNASPTAQQTLGTLAAKANAKLPSLARHAVWRLMIARAQASTGETDFGKPANP